MNEIASSTRELLHEIKHWKLNYESWNVKLLPIGRMCYKDEETGNLKANPDPIFFSVNDFLWYLPAVLYKVCFNLHLLETIAIFYESYSSHIEILFNIAIDIVLIYWNLSIPNNTMKVYFGERFKKEKRV